MDLHLAVSILRVEKGLDYSNLIEEEGQMTQEELSENTRVRGRFSIHPTDTDSQSSDGTS